MGRGCSLPLRSVGPVDKAPASGAGDSRLESWADQYTSIAAVLPNTAVADKQRVECILPSRVAGVQHGC